MTDVSPSSRGRGLKCNVGILLINKFVVALFTRAWIEMAQARCFIWYFAVALFTRAWIEIRLKKQLPHCDDVALFTRAWIEITTS